MGISSPSSLLQGCHLGWHSVHLRMSPIRVQVDDVHGSIDCTASACPPLGVFPESPGGFPKGEMSPQVLETQILKTQTNGQKWQFLLHFCRMLWGINIYSHVSHALKIPRGQLKGQPGFQRNNLPVGTCGKVVRLRDITCILVRTIWDHEGVPKQNFQTISASPRGTSRSSENTRSSRPGWWRCSHILNFWVTTVHWGSCICWFFPIWGICLLLAFWADFPAFFCCCWKGAVLNLRKNLTQWLHIRRFSSQYGPCASSFACCSCCYGGFHVDKDQEGSDWNHKDDEDENNQSTKKDKSRTSRERKRSSKSNKSSESKKKQQKQQKATKTKIKSKQKTALRFNLRWLLFTSFFPKCWLPDGFVKIVSWWFSPTTETDTLVNQPICIE